MIRFCWISRLGCLLFLLCIANSVKSQIHSSARMLALGGVVAGLPSHPGNLLVNPASLNGDDRLVALLGFRYMYYQPDVTAQLFLLHIPVSGLRGSFGVAGKRYGLESVYQDVSLETSYVRYVAPYFSLSFTAMYNRVYVPGYLDERNSGVGAGVFFSFSEKMSLGGFVRMTMKQEFKSMVVGLGACYKFSPQLLFTADLLNSQRPDIRMAGEYSIVPNYLHLRGGFSIVSQIPFAGLGLTFGNLGLDMASSFHSRLGMSPQFDFSYAFR